jgi:hypothetical protein
MDVSDKLTTTRSTFSKPAPSAATVSDSATQSRAKTTGYPSTPTVYNFGVSSTSPKLLVGGSGTNDIAVSYDGINWFASASPSANVTSINCIAHNGSVWVVGTTNSGSTGSIYYSADGVTWISAYSTSSSVSRLKHNGNMFVAFSSSGEAAYSYDGGNWLAGSITYAVASPTSISEIGWNGVYWLVGGNGTHTTNQHVWKSYDGINWTGIATVTSTSIYTIFWTGKFWFLSGITSSGVFKAISTNFDGTSWNVDTTGLDAVSIAYNGKVFVAASDATSDAISWSYDAINWNSLGNGTIFKSN